MIEYWENLSERERRLLFGGGALLVLALLYWGLWSPMASSLDSQRSAVASQQRQLSWMQQQATEVTKLRARGNQVKASGSLSAAVNGSARQLGITLSRIQPQGDDLQVWIDQIEFNLLISWMGELQSQQGIIAQSLDLNATDTPGQVRVRRLLLSRNP